MNNQEHYASYQRFYKAARSKISTGGLLIVGGDDMELSDIMPRYEEFKDLTVEQIDALTEDLKNAKIKTFDNATEAIIDTAISTGLGKLPGWLKVFGIAYPIAKGFYKDLKDDK